ncbi:hypothetical protein GmHk_15G044147 [Glycine max]|nr:hypothetical protein GmHk_15G044147 [Glycine max]
MLGTDLPSLPRMQMATPPSSLPPPPSPTGSPSTLKRTRKSTWLTSLATRLVGAERPLVHVDHGTGKADCPHKKKLRTYLGDRHSMNLISLKYLIRGQKRKYFRLWGSGGDNLSLI